jgi:putative hydrolase of the HAD superfamily
MHLDHIDTWLFDLDNTLYPPSAGLFAHIDVKMRAFIQRLLGVDPVEARRVQKQFFHDHGTTLRGLMNEHGVEPAAFLDYVHDIDMSAVAPDTRLVEAMARLPGRKLVFTNADTAYAERVLERLGLGGAFEAIHCIHGMDYWPKPDRRAYEALTQRYRIDPARALFVEDMARNLKPAKALGMTTVWVNNGSERGGHDASRDYIDIEIADVGTWLQTLTLPARVAA